MLIVNGHDAYDRPPEARLLKRERRNLPSVLLAKRPSAAHALPILCRTNGAVGNGGPLDVNRTASEMLIVSNAIWRVLITRHRTGFSAMHERERVGTGLKAADADERAMVLRAIRLPTHDDGPMMLCRTASE